MIVELKEKIAVKEIAAMIGAQLIGNGEAQVEKITTDSREVDEKSMFVAIKGERLDGHDYIPACARVGMVCALAERTVEGADCSYLIADDSVRALGRLAKAYKAKFNPLTIAVTGSIGKTTTKEFIWSVLTEKYKTLKSDGNHNNHIGVPMSVLGLSEDDKAAVFELGMNHSGEIDYLTRIVQPNIAVITNIGSSHIENLGSREGIRDAKMEIAAGLQPGGVLILNGDEPLLAGQKNALYVGMKNPECNVFVDNIIYGKNGSAFDLIVGGERIESLVIPVPGEHNVFNAAVAYTVGILAGMGEFEIRRGLRNYRPVGMRQHFFESDGRMILEDCYNAAPESMIAAMKVLCAVAKEQKLRPIAVLGDMRELGWYSDEGHRLVGKTAAELGVSMLFTFGTDAVKIAEAARLAGMEPDSVITFPDQSDPETLAQEIRRRTGKGDVILFKASRAVAMERVLKLLPEGQTVGG